MKKFFALLTGMWEQRSGADRFHDQEEIERELAHERSQQAQEQLRERIFRRKEGKAPTDKEILEPHPEKKTAA